MKDKGMNTVEPAVDDDPLLEVEDDDEKVKIIKHNPVESQIKDDKSSSRSGLSKYKKFSVDSTTTGLDDLRTKAFDESWFAGIS